MLEIPNEEIKFNWTNVIIGIIIMLLSIIALVFINRKYFEKGDKDARQTAGNNKKRRL